MSLRDCFDYDRQLIPVLDAQQRLRRHAKPLVQTTKVPLAHAMGRILAFDVQSPQDVPAFDNAAVDGWAFGYADGIERLRIMPGRAAAGHAFTESLPAACALRVLTGAVMPSGSDSVALQEEVRVEDDHIILPKGFKPFSNCRPAGEDMARGQTILGAGHRLRAPDVGALALMGLAEIDVFDRLRVAVFSTGDELLEPGMAARAGHVFDANRYILLSLLQQLPVDVRDLGRLPDDRARVELALKEASGQFDLIITSGGASQGDEDHVAAIMAAQGSIHFWRIALKPGRPLAFGQIGEALLVGLPGNPVAASICFALFARPLALALAGGQFELPTPPFVEAGFAMKKTKGRTEMIRVCLEPTSTAPRARKIAKQGSGVLTSLVEASGLILAGPEIERIEQGMLMPYFDFASLGLG